MKELKKLIQECEIKIVAKHHKETENTTGSSPNLTFCTVPVC